MRDRAAEAQGGGGGGGGLDDVRGPLAHTLVQDAAIDVRPPHVDSRPLGLSECSEAAALLSATVQSESIGIRTCNVGDRLHVL